MRLDKGMLEQSKQGNKHTLDFIEWYGSLHTLTQFIVEFISVNDAQAWKECYEQGQTPHEALRKEYPEDEFPYALGQAETPKDDMKGCPWCGELPHVSVHSGNGKHYVELECMNDECPTEHLLFSEMTRKEYEIEPIKQKLKSQWGNQRAIK